MKSKLSWVPFIPLALVACFLKLAQVLLPEGAVFGLSPLMMDYAFMAAVALVFVFSFILCTTDKKISTYYVPHRNYAAGVIGLLLALSFAADGANALFQLFGAGKIEALRAIDAVLALLSAVVFVVLGLNHSFRSKESKRFTLLYVIPALSCAVRMIVCFVSFTTISIRLADVSSLICYIFATLFFFNYAVTLSLTKTKNAVKSCFIFGFPAVAALLPYAVYHLLFEFDAEQLLNNVRAVEMLLMSLYILVFLIELTYFVRNKDDVLIVVEDNEEPELEENVDGFLTGAQLEDEKDNDEEDAVAYLEKSDTEGFLYQQIKPLDDEDNIEKQDVDGYLTKTEEPETTDQSETQTRDYESRLDEIDKLILDISSKSD